MSSVPCEDCGQPVNTSSAVCPHCGMRRNNVSPGVAGKLSKDEIRALVVVGDAGHGQEPSQGLLPTQILPHPATTGLARAAELLLTVVSFPMVAAGTLMIAVTRRASHRRKLQTTSGEVAPVVVMSGLSLPMYLTIFGMTPLGFGLTVGSIACLATRGMIRSGAATANSRELTRMDAPVLDTPKQLPARPSKPIVEPPKPVEVPTARVARGD